MNRFKYFIEWHVFGVCSVIGEKMGIAASTIRKNFIYISFLTMGSPIIIYLFIAFWMNIKRYILNARRNPLKYLWRTKKFCSFSSSSRFFIIVFNFNHIDDTMLLQDFVKAFNAPYQGNDFLAMPDPSSREGSFTILKLFDELQVMLTDISFNENW